MTITPEELGHAVRDARLGHAWTQADLAVRLGASREWGSRHERGGGAQMEAGLVLQAMHELGFQLVAPPSRSAAAPTRRRVSARAKQILLAEIEKGQQLAGHQPSPDAMTMAERIIDGDLDPAEAKSVLLAVAECP